MEHGRFASGTQLKVRDLAQQVGTSVMPVREAIRRLEESGLAVREPHKGAVVKSLTTDELRQTYEVRLLLEVEAARLGAAAVTEEDCVVMLRLCDQLEQAVRDGQIVTSLDLDEALLTVLHARAGNAVLLESIRGLWQRCRAYKLRGAEHAREHSVTSLWSFQPRLVAAARSHDTGAAAAVTRESMLSAMDRITATFAEAPRGA